MDTIYLTRQPQFPLHECTRLLDLQSLYVPQQGEPQRQYLLLPSQVQEKPS